MGSMRIFSYKPFFLVPCACLLVAIGTSFSLSLDDDATFVKDDIRTPYCSYNKTLIICEGWIPDAVPDMITEVVVTRINPVLILYPRCFCNVSWPNVVKLAVYFLPWTMVFLDGVFDCLGQLLSFKLDTGYTLITLTNDTFSDQANVLDFDFSGSVFLQWNELLQVLSNKINFPNLTHLRLAGAGVFTSLTVSQQFVDALALRPVIYLDISDVPSAWFSPQINNLCNTLNTIIYRHAQITALFLPEDTCSSLNLLDVSGSDWFAWEFEGLTCVNSYYVYELDQFFSAVRVLYMNEMIVAPRKLFIYNCSFFLFENTFVSEFHFSYNVLPSFDLMLINNRLEYLDLSNNKIETFNQLAFANLSRLNKLDLSYNHLNKISSNENQFPLLFAYNRKLRVLDLSSNGIPFLPDDIFKSNDLLQKIDLSHNMLEQVHFKVSHLYDMKVLDLSFNAIKRLDARSRQALDTLVSSVDHHRSWSLFHNISGLTISLEENPFSCDCDSLPFVKWFVASPIFSSTRHKYHCQLEGKNISMSNAAVGAAQQDCDRIKRKRIAVLASAITPTVGISVLVVVLRFLYRRRRRRKLQQLYEDRLRLVSENNLDYRFPVFLSYSSLDSEFVVQHVRQPLQRHLKALTRVDRELVCDADLHFYPGHNVFEEISRCLDETAVFIAVMSNNYCEGPYCKLEMQEARVREKPFLLIFMEHVEEEKMDFIAKEVFRNFARAKIVQEGDEVTVYPNWDQICESIIKLL